MSKDNCNGIWAGGAVQKVRQPKHLRGWTPIKNWKFDRPDIMVMDSARSRLYVADSSNRRLYCIRIIQFHDLCLASMMKVVELAKFPPGITPICVSYIEDEDRSVILYMTCYNRTIRYMCVDTFSGDLYCNVGKNTIVRYGITFNESEVWFKGQEFQIVNHMCVLQTSKEEASQRILVVHDSGRSVWKQIDLTTQCLEPITKPPFRLGCHLTECFLPSAIAITRHYIQTVDPYITICKPLYMDTRAGTLYIGLKQRDSYGRYDYPSIQIYQPDSGSSDNIQLPILLPPIALHPYFSVDYVRRFVYISDRHTCVIYRVPIL